MAKVNQDSEKLADRLVDIIRRLNLGESFTKAELARKYKVSERTIQRDIERLACLGIECKGRKYFIDSIRLGKFNRQNVLHFFNFTGTEALLPDIDKNLLDKWINNESMGFAVNGHHYELPEKIKEAFYKLQKQITEQDEVSFLYLRNNKTYQVQPYKLINQNGIWYLVAKDKDKIKYFSIGQIENIKNLFKKFTIDEKLLSSLEKEKSIWNQAEKVEVILKVNNKASHYFQRRALLPQQKIEKELENGELIISTMISHKLELFPIVRFWIPNVRIISPEEWQKALEEEIMEYLNRI